MQAAKYDPEDKKLAAVSLENMGVKELREYSRKCNAARNRGELNEQFREWIIGTEDVYHEKIANIYKVGNHKVQLAYYGMMYTILNYSGCYIMGRNSTPICISRKRYCEELKLNDRLGSNNIRNAIAVGFYSHNYALVIAARKNGEKVLVGNKTLIQLEPIFTELANEVRKIIDK